MTKIDFFHARIVIHIMLISSIPVFSSVVNGADDLLAHAIELRENYKEEEALQLFEHILAEEPENYQALLNAGFLHFRQGWLYREKRDGGAKTALPENGCLC